MVEHLPAELWHWFAFGGFVTVMLALDLLVFHRHAHEPTLRESALWTVFWCLLALAFNGLIWFWAYETFQNPADAYHPALEFLQGYLVEWSLSMDNVFIFAIIFRFFRVPLKYQYRVLFWGILGAVLMRLTFVLVGGAVLNKFEVAIVVFGAFLIYTAFKLAFGHDDEVDPEKNILMRWARKAFPVATGSHGDHFFAVENGKRCITPLFLVLLVVESTDVLFAVDSVPAIFGITRDLFIVFTSNVFAILGLRALYFLLAGVMDLFRYLKYGLSAILAFVGGKMIADFVAHQWFELEEGHHLLPPWASLAVIVGVLAIAIGASLYAKWREDRLGIKPADDAHPSPGHPHEQPEGPYGLAANPNDAAEEARTQADAKQ